jgi:hypothetical protein
MPAGVVRQNVEYKLWGAGGGGGGRDGYGDGGNGAGGGFISGTVDIGPGSLIEIYVGQGGNHGTTGGGASGGAGGETLSGFGGGTGGHAGGAGSSGSGGGGGGATVLLVDGLICAVAGGGGGGGGGGNRGPYVHGESSAGSFYPTQQDTYKSTGGRFYSWTDVILRYTIWEGNGNYTWRVYIPEDGSYTLTMSADNYAEFYLDEVHKLTSTTPETEFTSTFVITSGLHTIRIYGVNYSGPAGIGAKLVNALDVNEIVWTTLSSRNINHVSHGANGGDRDGDGGGGGAGGGGYYGGNSGLPIPNYDNGGYSGRNGSNFAVGQNIITAGQYASYRTPGGTSDSQYASDVGTGGLGTTPSVSGTAGGDGYAVLNFAKLPGFFYNNQGTYTTVVPSVKINGAYRERTIAYTKVSGSWAPILSVPSITFSTDNQSWGDSDVIPPPNAPVAAPDENFNYSGA